MTARIAQLRADTADCPPSPELLAQIEDVLTEGYARALAADRWSMRAEQRLQELVSNLDAPIRGRDLRALTHEHARFQRELVALRRELAELRREHRGIGAASR